MQAGPSMAESIKIFKALPRTKECRETFGLGRVTYDIYRKDIPDYWTDDLSACIEIGKTVDKWGFPFGTWGNNPAMIVDAVKVYDSVIEDWRSKNGNT